MATTKKPERIRVIRVKKGATREEIYAKVKKAFTADDLMRFLEDEPMFPLEDLVAEFEESDRKEAGKRRRKKKA